MDSCTIIIPFVKEFEFIDGVFRQIEKCQHPDIKIEVVVVNQSGKNLYGDIFGLAQAHGFDVYDIKCPQIDAGYPIDVGLQYATGEYVCTLDADAFPVKETWLYEPIQLIKKHNLSFVGKQTGLHNFPDYAQKSNFYHLNNYYRVSQYAIAKEISEQVSFMRPQNRHKANINPKSGNEYTLDWADNGVMAQMYSDDKELGDKFSYPINSVLGAVEGQGIYGTVIDDKVFHMVFGYFEEHSGPKKGDKWNEYLYYDTDTIIGIARRKQNELSLKKNIKPYYENLFHTL
jgi:hypothetical protein